MLSDDALSVLIPMLEEIVGLRRGADPRAVRSARLVLQEWDKIRTDSLTIRGGAIAPHAVA